MIVKRKKEIRYLYITSNTCITKFYINYLFLFQTSYKKPGPPTPSKNGGRVSLSVRFFHYFLSVLDVNGNNFVIINYKN